MALFISNNLFHFRTFISFLHFTYLALSKFITHYIYLKTFLTNISKQKSQNFCKNQLAVQRNLCVYEFNHRNHLTTLLFPLFDIIRYVYLYILKPCQHSSTTIGGRHQLIGSALANTEVKLDTFFFIQMFYTAWPDNTPAWTFKPSGNGQTTMGCKLNLCT